MRRARTAVLWAAIGVVGALLGWKLLAELIEPHLLLWFVTDPAFVEAPLVDGTSVRLYAAPRPHVGKIAGLQKGLVWMRDGRPLVEEGYGFGCPILVVDGLAYLSSHAEVRRTTLEGAVRLVKRYEMDTVDTPIQFLKRKYRAVPSLGVVEVEYDVYPDGRIDVHVDFSEVSAAWEMAYLMNEQGARRFVRYYDTNGVDLQADQIGIWDLSPIFVERGCFEGRDAALTFCVEPSPPAVVYFGRERYDQYNWRGTYYLSWSGIDIELEGPWASYDYVIELEAR